VKAEMLVANLPYNIATSVIMRALEGAGQIRRLTVMTQKEVGERLVARPGSKVYGAPTVLASYFATSRIEGRISRKAFWPVPGVDSLIVSFDRKGVLPKEPYETFARVVKAAFAQRRKTLRNTLVAAAGSLEASEAVLEGAGIQLSSRAEQLALDDYLSITRALLED
jgi:16S rRNA (adenine1518-N6/adenine1519-N6)-dimethyltransferase